MGLGLFSILLVWFFGPLNHICMQVSGVYVDSIRSFACTSVAALEEAQLLASVSKGDGCGAGDGLQRADILSQLGGESLEALALGTSACSGRPNADNTRVDGTRDAVLQLHVDLGQCEQLLVVCIVVFDVSLGGAVDHLAHLESLNGLVFADEASAVVAPHRVRVTLVLLSSSVVSSLRWHF